MFVTIVVWRGRRAMKVSGSYMLYVAYIVQIIELLVIFNIVYETRRRTVQTTPVTSL